jgi:hypothetical protein
MSQMHTRASSVPDNLTAWTTASALIAFGIIFFDDAAIMGRTILALGFISAANQVLKPWEIHSQAAGRYRYARLILAIAYVTLMAGGLSLSAWTVAET